MLLLDFLAAELTRYPATTDGAMSDSWLRLSRVFLFTSILPGPLVAQSLAMPSCATSGGSVRLSPRVAAVYTLRVDSAGARLDAVIVARGQPEWDRGLRPGQVYPQPRRAELTDRPEAVGGASLDTLAVLYDNANKLAWVGSRRIAMGDGNILLLDHIDNVGGPLNVLPLERGDLRIPSSMASCGKPFTPTMDSALVATLRANPAIHAFLRR